MAYERSEPIAESSCESDVKIDYRLVDYMDEINQKTVGQGSCIERIMWHDRGYSRHVDQFGLTILRNSKLKLELLKLLLDIMLTGAVDLLKRSSN